MCIGGVRSAWNSHLSLSSNLPLCLLHPLCLWSYHQDLLIPPGQSLQELTNKDAGQIQQLTKAAAEARAAAVTAIIAGSHQQPFPATAGSGSSGRTTGAAAAVALAGGCEIEPAEGDRGDGGSIEAAGARLSQLAGMLVCLCELWCWLLGRRV